MTDPLSFIHSFAWDDMPAHVRARLKLSMLDLIGVGAGGRGTQAAQIMADYACAQMGGDIPILFDGRRASVAGAALTAGMSIDALDGHDGYRPAKGHIGCVLFAAILPVAINHGSSGNAFLEALAMGYEFGARASVAQHGTVPDYHTSGSWGAVTAAAACARLMALSPDQTRHALGIAEYHGPRSQMMRVIDHPTMLKDGASWGAMTGVSAAYLAAQGFTGAPAITIEQAPGYWADLGKTWTADQQYFKPYPVCRWAQPAMRAILDLRAKHGLTSADVTAIKITTFHESTRLATPAPRTTEEAQYSTSFPCAVAMVQGDVTPADLSGAALSQTEVLRISQSITMVEDAHANDIFPDRRIAKVAISLTNGQVLHADWTEAQWDPTDPPSATELQAKYHRMADPILGQPRAQAIAQAIDDLESADFKDFAGLITQPISA